MSSAKLERTQLKIKATSHSEIFQAKGEVLLFDGFLKVYLEGTDEENEEAQGILPAVTIGDKLELHTTALNPALFTTPSSLY